MSLTTLLKKSIQFERSKTDVNNLLNHKAEDLQVMIEVIEEEREYLEHTIQSRQELLDTAEDLDEGLEVDQRTRMGKDKAKLETLLAWRLIFLDAQRVNTK